MSVSGAPFSALSENRGSGRLKSEGCSFTKHEALFAREASAEEILRGLSSSRRGGYASQHWDDIAENGTYCTI